MVVFFWWCGGVCVVVFLFWCGGVFEVFLCFCDGVFVCFFVKERLSLHYREAMQRVLTTLV